MEHQTSLNGHPDINELLEMPHPSPLIMQSIWEEQADTMHITPGE